MLKLLVDHRAALHSFSASHILSLVCDKLSPDVPCCFNFLRFVPAKFEEIFSKYAKTSPDRMNFNELLNMTASMQNAYDFFGW